MSRLKEARELYERALEITIKLRGRVHYHVATLQNNIAVILKQTGEFEKAIEMYNAALVLRKHLNGKDHPNVAQVRFNCRFNSSCPGWQSDHSNFPCW